MWTQHDRIQHHGADSTAQLSEMHRETGVWLHSSTYPQSQDLNTKQLPSMPKSPPKKQLYLPTVKTLSWKTS